VKHNLEKQHLLILLFDLCINATLINEQKFLNLSLGSENDDEYNVKFFVLNFLLGGNLALDGERRKMVDHLLLSPTESSSTYMLGLAAFLTGVI